MTEALRRELDEAVTEAKGAARAQVAKELQELMREMLPRTFAKMKKHLALPENGKLEVELKRTMAQVLTEDRSFSARFFVGRVAGEHFRMSIYDAVASEVELRGRVYGVVDVGDTVRRVLEMCRLGREVYPEIAKPRMPRSSDVARLVHRYCRRPWKTDEHGRTVWKRAKGRP